MSFDSKLWYDRPASQWTAATPMGNGRTGIMIFGGTDVERIQVNDDTLYSDEPGTRDLDLDITGDYDRVRALIKEGGYGEADDILADRWTGRAQPCYQPLGDILIHFRHDLHEVRNYHRELDIAKSLCTISYELGGAEFRRELFVSKPADAVVCRIVFPNLESEFSISLDSPHPTASVSYDGDSLILAGQAPGLALRRTLEYVEERKHQWKYPELWNPDGSRKSYAKQVLYGDVVDGRGMYFELRLKVVAPEAGVSWTGEELQLRGCHEVLIIASTGTSFNGFDKIPSKTQGAAAEKPKRSVSVAAQIPYGELLDKHIGDYRNLFDRVKIDLGKVDPDTPLLTTDQRLARHLDLEDPGLIAQYFQFGRYLMISGSRGGTQPLNLQGIWNEEVLPPWASGYTININAEMNYWPTLTASLPECYQPLVRLIDELSVSGGEVARRMYGCRGWTAHHNTTIWRSAQPVDGSGYICLWPMGAGWLCQHLWEYYLFTGDQAFLETKALPLIRGAAEFFVDWLVEDESGLLITPISNSPENRFLYESPEGDRESAGICVASAMDMTIIREVFENFVTAAEIVGADSEMVEQVKGMIRRLKTLEIGTEGQLLEWHREFAEGEPEHRHVSHLYGLHPGSQITPDKTPELFAAVRKSLQLRGDKATGWSMGWKINLWARLLDGNHALKMVKALITPERTYPNLFDAHPPFQIDGNFGGTAGIVEMLCQSRYFPGAEEDPKVDILLLPSLPDDWPDGAISGISARGGFVLDIRWNSGLLRKVQVFSKLGNAARLRYEELALDIAPAAGEKLTLSKSDLQRRE